MTKIMMTRDKIFTKMFANIKMFFFNTVLEGKQCSNGSARLSGDQVRCHGHR